LAERLGVDKGGFPADLEATTAGVFDSWQHGDLQKGATLHIITYRDLPGYELALGDEQAIVHLSGTSGMSLGSRSFTCVFSAGRDADMGKWCASQLADLDQADPRTFTVQ
jgi:hypothetical protein